MIALLVALALAEPVPDALFVPQGPHDAVVSALDAELARSVAELSLPDAPALYFLRYQLMRLEQVDSVASLGATVRTSVEPLSTLGVEVRVGAPEYDNTGFGGWQNGFGSAALPAELTPQAASLAAWRLTDRAYKQAVEQYARKRAQFEAPDDYPGDFTLTGPQVANLDVPAPGDGPALVALAEDLSGQLVVSPSLARGEVYLGHEAGSLVVLDSAGSHVTLPVHETTVRAVLHARTDDGMLLTDQLLWTVRDPSALPERAAMEAEAHAAAVALGALRDAPVLDEEYVGPVVFEDTAATELFRYLLVPQVEGTPGEVPFDSWFGDLGRNKDPVRLMRRVLPPGWSAVDDPMADPSHPSAFARDLEGTPSQAVLLVEDGIVRDLLMSRVPRRDIAETNGHARGRVGALAEGRVSQLSVEPRRRVRSLHKQAVRLAGSYDRDWYLVVRRLQVPAVREVGSWDVGDGGALPPPVAVFRVYADGREEQLRGAAFTGVSRFALRDIAAAGEQVTASWMAAPSGGSRFSALAPTEGLPTRLDAPEVLVRELELVPTPGDPREVPVLPPPE